MSAAAQDRRERPQPTYSNYVVRHHAIAAAAIVLEGRPKIEEPLRRAWERTLRHFRIEVKNLDLLEGQAEAARQLEPKSLNDEVESVQFAKIFSNAPAWFLQFTTIALDALCLKFELPEHMMTPQKWRSHGFEDARRWPRLPSSTMTAGDPIPPRDERQLVIALCSVPPPILQLNSDSNSRPSRPVPRLLRDIAFALDLDDKPEEQWTRYERRRMRQLEQKIARL